MDYKRIPEQELGVECKERSRIREFKRRKETKAPGRGTGIRNLTNNESGKISDNMCVRRIKSPRK